QAAEQIQAAQAAYEQVRDVSPATRADWLEAIAAGLEQHADELAEIAGRETHLAEARLRFELKRSVFQLRLFREEILHGENLDATIDHADPDWGMGPRPDIRK